jgi:hypothetical protein
MNMDLGLLVSLCIMSMLLCALLFFLFLRYPIQSLIPPMPPMTPLPVWSYEKKLVELNIRARAEGEELKIEIGDRDKDEVFSEFTVDPKIIEAAGWRRV